MKKQKPYKYEEEEKEIIGFLADGDMDNASRVLYTLEGNYPNAGSIIRKKLESKYNRFKEYYSEYKHGDISDINDLYHEALVDYQNDNGFKTLHVKYHK